MVKLEELVEKMSGHGWRVTDQRKSLVQLFLDSNQYMSPREVYGKLEAQYPGLSFDTVYRNLRLLADIGIVEQTVLDEGVKFKLHCQEHSHHHHLICVDCERTFPLLFCPMEHTLLPEGFAVRAHRFEVYGQCSACQTGTGQ